MQELTRCIMSIWLELLSWNFVCRSVGLYTWQYEHHVSLALWCVSYMDTLPAANCRHAAVFAFTFFCFSGRVGAVLGGNFAVISSCCLYVCCIFLLLCCCKMILIAIRCHLLSLGKSFASIQRMLCFYLLNCIFGRYGEYTKLS